MKSPALVRYESLVLDLVHCAMDHDNPRDFVTDYFANRISDYVDRERQAIASALRGHAAGYSHAGDSETAHVLREKAMKIERGDY